MRRAVTVTSRWLGPVPVDRRGNPIPRNQWPRKRHRSWVARWYTANNRRLQKSFKTKLQADEFAAAKQVELDCNPTARRNPRKITLNRFIDEVVDLATGPRGQHLTPASVTDYRLALKKLVDFLGGDTLLNEITAADAARFVAMLKKTPHVRSPKKKLSPAMVNKIKRTVKAVLNIAVRQLGYLIANPFDGQSQDRLPDRPKRYVDAIEFDCLLRACKDLFDESKSLWWRTLLAVLYCGGVRINEAIHLTWTDVDFESDRIRVIARRGVLEFQPKGKKSRIIPLPKVAIDLLARLQVEQAEKGNPYVFIRADRLLAISSLREAGEWKESRETVNNLRRVWNRIVSVSKIPKATLHDLRRSAITNWARRLPAHVTQSLAGHANIQTTMGYYVKVLDADMDAARQAIEDVLQKTPDALGTQ